MAGVRRPPAVARVLERVTGTAREHEMFQPGDLVLASVSGGPDSVCLLYSLWYLRRLLKIKLAVFHFDHKLRPDSNKDAEYVKRLAARLKLPFFLREAESKPRKGESIEAWAHNQRFVARFHAKKESDANRVAIAHTLDDQAESVLMAAITGSGSEKLKGMEPADALAVRPLLKVTRLEVEAFCRSLGLRPRRDPMNADPRFLRNAIRLKGLPALERAVRRNVRLGLASTGELAREDAAELARHAKPLVEEWAGGAWRDSHVLLPGKELRELPPAISRRVVHGALLLCRGHPSLDNFEAILDLAKGRPGRKRDLSGGLKAWRDREYVHVSRASPKSRPEGGTR